MGILFGTDGVRGIANTELTGTQAYNLGRAGAYVLTKEKKHTPKILVGLDTRISGDMLESALVAGICSVGAEAIQVGIIPTPAVAYLVRKYNAPTCALLENRLTNSPEVMVLEKISSVEDTIKMKINIVLEASEAKKAISGTVNVEPQLSTPRL